jgi:NTP pyrophosphatase (non-canonical NTP hydrolase)
MSDQNTQLILTPAAFIRQVNAFSMEVHQNAINKGFYDGVEHDTPMIRQLRNSERIAQIHGELSEAFEGLRHGNPPDDKIPEFTSAEAELADAIIRILDFAAYRGYRVAEALIAKAAFNTTRPRLHGKLF